MKSTIQIRIKRKKFLHGECRDANKQYRGLIDFRRVYTLDQGKRPQGPFSYYLYVKNRSVMLYATEIEVVGPVSLAKWTKWHEIDRERKYLLEQLTSFGVRLANLEAYP